MIGTHRDYRLWGLPVVCTCDLTSDDHSSLRCTWTTKLVQATKVIKPHHVLHCFNVLPFPALRDRPTGTVEEDGL